MHGWRLDGLLSSDGMGWSKGTMDAGELTTMFKRWVIGIRKHAGVHENKNGLEETLHEKSLQRTSLR